MQINVNMKPADFTQLWNSHMHFGASWGSQITSGRFESLEDLCLKHARISTEWPHAYWLDDWASVILARAYIEHYSDDYVVVWDNAVDEYVILTNHNWEDHK